MDKALSEALTARWLSSQIRRIVFIGPVWRMVSVSMNFSGEPSAVPSIFSHSAQADAVTKNKNTRTNFFTIGVTGIRMKVAGLPRASYY